jgi:hypothetical protein
MRDTISPYEVLTVEQCASAPSLDWAYTSAMRLLQQPVDAAISSILEDLGRASAADRAWTFEYDADLLRFHNTHEWSRRGIASFVEDLQGTGGPIFPGIVFADLSSPARRRAWRGGECDRRIAVGP